LILWDMNLKCAGAPSVEESCVLKAHILHDKIYESAELSLLNIQVVSNLSFLFLIDSARITYKNQFKMFF